MFFKSLNMEINDQYQNIEGEFKNAISEESNVNSLRNIHINVEYIYEDLKHKRSSGFYKTSFLILFSISALVFIIHIVKFKLSFGIFLILLLILYYFYFNFRIKQSLKIHIKTKPADKIDPENAEFLKHRIQYISEGILVTLDRSSEVRNFFMIFFPLLIFTFIDIVKGPMTLANYIISFFVSAILGSIIWYYYFGLDKDEIKDNMKFLEEQKEQIDSL